MGKSIDAVMGLALLTAPISTTCWLEENGLRWLADTLALLSLVVLPFKVAYYLGEYGFRRLVRQSRR